MKIQHWILGAILVITQSSIFGEMHSYNNNHSSSRHGHDMEMGNAEHFQGFDINAGAGFGGITLMTERSGIKPQSSTDYGADGVAVQAKVGWNCAFAKIGLIGIEGYGQYNSAETKNRFFETTTSTTATSRTFTMRWNLGLDLRLGIAPTPTNLIFIYGGPDWGQHKFEYITTGVNSTYREFRLGGALGAGLEQILADRWKIRATFDYRWYPSKTLNYSNGEQQKIKARLATALFMFGYVF